MTTTQIYREYNANPKKRKTSDCVIRALTVALNKKYEIVARDLFNISHELVTTQTATETYTHYLDKYYTLDKIYVMHLVNGKRKRLTVRDICQKFKKGTFVVTVANHLVAVKDGQFYDTFDCSNKSAYKIWRVA